MAYTPINWQTGDTITADKLNKMDNGWGVSSTQLFSETVTTAIDPDYPDDPPSGLLSYSLQMPNATITVTYDGTDYTCPCTDNGDSYSYGGVWGESGPDFSEYPFIIYSSVDFGYENSIATETTGSHTISVTENTISVGSQFQSAVNSFVDTSTVPMRCISGTTTAQAVYQAIFSGHMLFFNPYNNQYQMCFVTELAQDGTVSFVPTLSGVTASVQGGLFVVSYS